MDSLRNIHEEENNSIMSSLLTLLGLAMISFSVPALTGHIKSDSIQDKTSTITLAIIFLILGVFSIVSGVNFLVGEIRERLSKSSLIGTTTHTGNAISPEDKSDQTINRVYDIRQNLFNIDLPQ
jgi:hypothetical protein